MAAPLSIDAYKRKQNVLAAKAHKRRVSTSSNQSCSKSKETYTADQRQYLDACVEKHADPDSGLLTALREARFVLKLDRFGGEELAFNMGYLQQTKTCKHISLSLRSVAINRDLRTKFQRLGLTRAYAYEDEGASIVVRSASASACKTPNLERFHLSGVKISPEVVPLLSKALFHCHQLEDICLNGTSLGDEGIEAIAVPLGKCPKVRTISLAGCNLTGKSKDHITKIIALHGVIMDEAIWSSSLRGEVASTPSMPELLINLSCNNLGDEAAEAICDALYNDKWLLGLNLSGNKLTQQGTKMFIDTLSKCNQTLAVLTLANMKDPVEASTLETLDSLLYNRNRFLQQVATESREKRMALGSLLLEWGVDKDMVVEICYLESPGKDASAKYSNSVRMVSNNLTLASPKGRVDRVYPRSTLSSSHQINDNINNNAEDEDEEEEDNKLAASTADGHIKTIEYLIERLSALEAERRKTLEYVNKIEDENRQLRAELEARTEAKPTPGISPIEAEIIAQLETSISSLAEQVEFMEHGKQQQPPSSESRE